MIGKNVGIRRARGQFVLATNIDILFSDELAKYLAARRLEPGRMYRIDRHDAMSDVQNDDDRKLIVHGARQSEFEPKIDDRDDDAA